MFTSCLSGRHRLICWIDNLAHRTHLGRRRICELHDDLLLKHLAGRDLDDLNPKRWTPVETTGPTGR